MMSCTPSSGPSKAIRNIASRFLLPNIFPTLVLIKFCFLKAWSHAALETHCTWANSTRMRLGYRACKAWFQVIMPHKSLKFLSPHFIVHQSLQAEFTLTCRLVHKRREFESSVWAVYPKPQANKATVTSIMHSIKKILKYICLVGCPPWKMPFNW